MELQLLRDAGYYNVSSGSDGSQEEFIPAPSQLLYVPQLRRAPMSDYLLNIHPGNQFSAGLFF